jgi:hypothetical protein
VKGWLSQHAKFYLFDRFNVYCKHFAVLAAKSNTHDFLLTDYRKMQGLYILADIEIKLGSNSPVRLD